VSDMTLYDRYSLATARLEAGQPLEAARTLEPVATEVAQSASAQLLLARAYFGSAQLSRARAAFARVVELDPTDDYAHFALGRVAERSGDVQAAMGHYRVAAALAPRSEYLDRVAAIPAA
jgi:Tfp pilus assembly protein PilF